MQQITVKPFVDGKSWLLDHEGAEPMLFRSGAFAEAAARSLARRLADAGVETRTTVLLRDGAVAGSFVTRV